MARFANPTVQYLDGNGNPLSGGSLTFYASGTTTLKNTYSNNVFTIVNPNPVVLDSEGRTGEIFLDGSYKVVLQDSKGSQEWERDPVGSDTASGAFGDWQAAVTYSIPDIVTGSDNRFYISLQNSNLANDPILQPSSFWVEGMFIKPYNASNSFRQGELTIGSDGRTYQSQVGANIGNDPVTDLGTNWRQLLQDGDSFSVGSLTFSKTDVQSLDAISYLNDNFVRWRWQFDASENLNLAMYDGAGTFTFNAMAFTPLTGNVEFRGNATFRANVNLDDPVTAIDFFTISRNGQALPVDLELTSNAAQPSIISFQDADVNRWILGQDISNNFALNRYNGAGVLIDTPFEIRTDGTGVIANNLEVTAGDLEFQAVQPSILNRNTLGNALGIDFLSTTTDTRVEIFRNTNASGVNNLEVYKADGSATVVHEINASGYMWLAKDEAGVKIRKFTLSTLAPSGGVDGDIWMRY